MNNLEYNKREVINVLESIKVYEDECIPVKNGVVAEYGTIPCKECDFKGKGCATKLVEWFLKEHKDGHGEKL